MKTTLSICGLAISALLAGHAIAGDSPRGDGHRFDLMSADKDGDGKVSRAEAAAAADQRASQWFDKLDLNKDGFVTQDEIQQSREAHRGEMKEKFDEHFKEADANNDGKLSLDEVQAKMPRLAARFGELDTDKDGFLTKDEMQRGAMGWHHQPQPNN